MWTGKELIYFLKSVLVALTTMTWTWLCSRGWTVGSGRLWGRVGTHVTACLEVLSFLPCTWLIGSQETITYS